MIALRMNVMMLDVFPCHLLAAYRLAEYVKEFLVCRRMAEILEALYFLIDDMLLEAVEQTIKSRLGCVRDEREDRMAGIAVDGLQNSRDKLFTELLALTIDILIRTTGEIDALKGASRVALRLKDLLDHRLTITANDQMVTNTERARKTISSALQLLKQAHQNKMMSRMPQIWTDYKRDELTNIFQGKGTAKEREEIYNLLTDINASQNNAWEKIKE